MAIISNNLSHDSVAVFRASQQFKNKSNFANLLTHEADFGIPAKWHFHPTAHGKGACDDIGVNLKRNAARLSLQCSAEDRILDVIALFQRAKKYCKETEINFSSEEDQAVTAKKLKSRFDAAVTIKGTLQ